MWALGVGLSTPGVLVAAADTATQGFDISQIITAGVTPALVLVLILTGKLYPSGIVDSYRQRAERAEAGLDEFRNIMIDRVVPAMTASTEAIKLITAPARRDDPYDDAPTRPSPRRVRE